MLCAATDNIVGMFLTRFIGRAFLAAAAKSESSAATAAAASMATSRHNPLEEFFEKDRGPDDQKPVYGTSLYSLVGSIFPLLLLFLF